MRSPDPGLENLAEPLPLPSSLSPSPASASVRHLGQLPAQALPPSPLPLPPTSSLSRHAGSGAGPLLTGCSQVPEELPSLLVLLSGPLGAPYTFLWAFWSQRTGTRSCLCLALLMSCQGLWTCSRGLLTSLTPCTAPTSQSFLSLRTWSQSMGYQMLAKVIYGRLLPGRGAGQRWTKSLGGGGGWA